MNLTRRSWLSAMASAPLAATLRIPRASAADTIKVGILHSLSGTMAISETILKDLYLWQITEINKRGGLIGRQIEPVVVDPASNWPLFAEKARELISQDKVDAIFGCWTAVSRKSVLPVVEELNGLLFTALEMEGEESSYNIFYGSSNPDNKAIPATAYLMSKEGGSVQRFVLEGTDYAYPRTSNKIIRAFLKSKGVADADIMENYTPFGFADWQNEVAAIKKFGSAGKKTAVISTINGDANVPFYKELGNQGIKATDIPVMGFSVGEEELAGIDTKPLVGHLTAWSYFESMRVPENQKFIKDWHERSDGVGLSADQHVGPCRRASRIVTCGCSAPGADRAEDAFAVGLRCGDGQQSLHLQAAGDRRDQGGRSVRHRLSEQDRDRAACLESLSGKRCRQGGGLDLSLGLRRLRKAALHGLNSAIPILTGRGVIF
jgi:branched-chain amino acid transport system substrate-binding protein/urea transport system substrate-binding protein